MMEGVSDDYYESLSKYALGKRLRENGLSGAGSRECMMKRLKDFHGGKVVALRRKRVAPDVLSFGSVSALSAGILGCLPKDLFVAMISVWLNRDDLVSFGLTCKYGWHLALPALQVRFKDDLEIVLTRLRLCDYRNVPVLDRVPLSTFTPKGYSYFMKYWNPERRECDEGYGRTVMFKFVRQMIMHGSWERVVLVGVCSRG